MSRKFPMDLSKFKKIKVDNDATVLRHPHGHEIKIAHKAIGPEMKSKLDALPHYSGGGIGGNVDVDKAREFVGPHKELASSASSSSSGQSAESQGPKPPATQGPSNEELDSEAKAIGDREEKRRAERKAASASTDPNENRAHGGMIPHYYGGSPDTVSQQDAPEMSLTDKIDKATQGNPAISDPMGRSASPPAEEPAPPTMTPPQAAAPTPPPNAQQQAPPTDPWGTEETLKNTKQGIELQNKGHDALATAAEAKGKAEAQTLVNAIKQQQDQQTQYQHNLKNITDEHDALMQDIQNTHIDPQHYLGTRGFWPNMFSGIGLLLGGMGAGLTGGENPAMKYLNSQIDRDIDAQKANLGKKESLLSANMRHYGNLRDAMDATRAGMQGIVNMQIQQAAATSTGPNARAIADLHKGELQTQQAGVLGQMAARKTLLGAQSQGGGQAVNPYAVIRTLVPEHDQEATNKELKDAQELTKSRDSVKGAFNRIAQLNTPSNWAAHPVETSKQIKAMKSVLAGLSKDTAGKFTDKDSELLATLLPSDNPLSPDSPATLKSKAHQLDQELDKKMNFPKLKFYGIDPTNSQRASGQSRLKTKIK